MTEYGVRNGHVETVHSFTNDQNLIDNFHKGSRRGRAAGLNMVLTETGAAKAVAKALPELKGKLSGNPIRVSTPNVSMAILNLNLEKATSVDELNAFLRETSMNSEAAQPDRLCLLPRARLQRPRRLEAGRCRRWSGHDRRR